MKWLHMLTFLLTAVGALNWGLVSLFNLNLVEFIFGAWPVLVQIVYIAVGVSAVYILVTHFSDCKVCSK